MAINRDNFLKNKVRFRHRHESKEQLLENTDLASFRYGIEDNAEWLKGLEDDPDSLNTKQLIVLDELRWEVSALFNEAMKLLKEYKFRAG